MTINTTAGTVSTKGDGSFGIVVGSTSGIVDITTADIKTEGELSNGIQAGNTGPDSAMTIDTTAGKITTLGMYASGISANTGSFVTHHANAGLLQILAGDIEVTGQGGYGVVAGAYNGPIDISVLGDISTGALGADGVFAMADGTTAAKVTVDGSITTSADAANGIYITGAPGLNSDTIIVNGEINAQGANAYGILLTGADDAVTVNTGGSVTGGKAGVRLQQLGAAKLTNTGHIAGGGGTAVEFLGNFASTFDNDGSVTGDVLLGDGADTAILGTNTSITGNVDGEGGSDTLQLVGAGSASIDAATLLDFEIGEKAGSGTWTLTGTNSLFAPSFAVNDGRLAVNGVLANTTFTVADGAILGGGGTLGGATVASGGTIGPGNSIGILNMATVMFNAGSVFEVELDPNLADLLLVSGDANIDSAAMVSVKPAPGTYVDGSTYRILSAGNLIGTFGSVVDNSAFLDFSLDSSVLNEVWLRLAVVANFPDVAETPNQLAAATGLQELGAGNPLFDAIAVLDADSARNAFDLSSGEIHATAKGTLLNDARFIREAAIDRLRERFGVGFADANEPLGYASPEKPIAAPWPGAGAGSDLAVWGEVFGSGATIAGDGNAASASRGIGGLIAGVDATLADGWRFGVATGFQHSSLDVTERLSSAAVDGYHLAAYGGYEDERFAARFGAAMTWQDVATTRSDSFSGFSETLAADYQARTAQIFAELAGKVRYAEIDVEPFANAAVVDLETDGFTETGGAAALTAAASHQSTVLTGLGLRFHKDLSVGDRRVGLRGMIAWQHASGDVAPSSSMAFAGGTPFSIEGAPLAADVLRLDLGLVAALSARAKASLNYSGAMGNGIQDHGLTGRIAVGF